MAEMKVFLGMMARKIDRYEYMIMISLLGHTNTVMVRSTDGTEIRTTAADTMLTTALFIY